MEGSPRAARGASGLAARRRGFEKTARSRCAQTLVVLGGVVAAGARRAGRSGGRGGGAVGGVRGRGLCNIYTITI